MKTKPFKQLLMAVTLLLACPSHGSTIFWGSDFNSVLLTSDGQPLDGSFSFELGAFTSGFEPTIHNTNQWQANWKVFDRAFDPTPADPNDGDPEGWNEIDRFFVGTVDHNSAGGSSSPDANPADAFAQDDVAYLWVYNSKSIVPGSEWALVKDITNLPNIWRFPDPNDSSSYNWDLANADAAIIGGVNGVQGDGAFSFDPGTFNLQTHVVPEPGSALLLMFALMAWTSSRRLRP